MNTSSGLFWRWENGLTCETVEMRQAQEKIKGSKNMNRKGKWGKERGRKRNREKNFKKGGREMIIMECSSTPHVGTVQLK